MKKAKIMLIAIAVLATVGGALAFKATKFNFEYCTLPTTLGPGDCILNTQLSPSRFVQIGETPETTYYYSTKTTPDCDQECIKSTSFVVDGQ